MWYLIDGYNLLFAMGVLRPNLGPAGLEKARRRLLGLLAGAYGPEEAPHVTVIFDSARAPAGATEVQDYQGVRVRFAGRGQEADDLIEQLIGHDSAPKQLTVVSDDHRVRDAGRRRGCAVLGCGDYLDWLARHRKGRRRPPGAGAKPEKVSAAEERYWLDEFAGLEEDPELRPFFELDRFPEANEE
jgi:hypothetical protein